MVEVVIELRDVHHAERERVGEFDKQTVIFDVSDDCFEGFLFGLLQFAFIKFEELGFD